MKNNKSQQKKKVLKIFLISIVSVISISILISVSNRLFGPAIIKGNDRISESKNEPLIGYEDFETQESKILSLDGKVIKQDDNIEFILTNTDTIFLAYSNNKGKIEKVESSVNGKLTELNMPKEAYSKTIFSILYSESKKYIAFVMQELDETYQTDSNEESYARESIAKIWIYDIRNDTWSKEITSDMTNINISYLESSISSSYSWNEDSDVFEIELTDYKANTESKDYIIGKYTYDAKTSEIMVIKELGNIDDYKLSEEEKKDEINSISYSVESNSVKVPLTFTYISISSLFQPNTYYFDKSSCGFFCSSKIYDKSEIFDSEYLKVTDPLIGKQSIIYIDEKTKEEKELLSWFSTKGANQIDAHFAHDSNKIVLVINDRMGVYDLDDDKFRWIMDVNYQNVAVRDVAADYIWGIL
ncbi:hypothetical protein JW887_04640 [Candidatus Dojkabacteria bacterium]|nr:hypothetical protein [Candidatus Dojkabacteria bacterium]